MSDNGEMNSNPLHLMYPDLALAEKEFALRYLISAGLFGTKEG
jgi:hypothetical protein